jgi:hypothetical protein
MDTARGHYIQLFASNLFARFVFKQSILADGWWQSKTRPNFLEAHSHPRREIPAELRCYLRLLSARAICNLYLLSALLQQQSNECDDNETMAGWRFSMGCYNDFSGATIASSDGKAHRTFIRPEKCRAGLVTLGVFRFRQHPVEQAFAGFYREKPSSTISPAIVPATKRGRGFVQITYHR